MTHYKKASVFFAVWLMIISIGGCSMNGGKAEEVQNAMKVHLKEKYGMDFEFKTKPYLLSKSDIPEELRVGNISEKYKYQVKAYPIGKPELEFFVEAESDASGEKSYPDAYLQTKWTYQGKQEVEKKIKEIYGENANYQLKYELSYNDSKYKDLDYTQVIKACEGNATVFINLDIALEKDFNKAEQAENAYQLIKPFVLDTKLDRYDVAFQYLTKEYMKEYSAFEKEYKDNGNTFNGNELMRSVIMKGLDELYNEKKLFNALLPPYHSKEFKPLIINKAEDLMQWYKF